MVQFFLVTLKLLRITNKLSYSTLNRKKRGERTLLSLMFGFLQDRFTIPIDTVFAILYEGATDADDSRIITAINHLYYHRLFFLFIPYCYI